MEYLLNNSNTYSFITRDPTSKINFHSLMRNSLNKNYNSKSIYRYLNVNTPDFNLPRAYRLPAIHKQGNFLRIFVSFIEDPLYNLATYLHDVVHKRVPKASSYTLIALIK